MPARAVGRPPANAEAAALEELARESDDPVVRARCRIVLDVWAGLTPGEIGRRLGRSPESVRRVVRRYEVGGVAALAERPRLRRARAAPGSAKPADSADPRAEDLGHELRSSLSTILGYARLMQAAPPDSLDRTHQAELVAGIKEAGEYMLRLLNNVLDLRRMELGTEPRELTSVAIEHLLRTALLMASPLAVEKRIDLAVEVEPGLPPLVMDELLARRALDNLLSNAVKYTPPGGTVRLSARREGDGVAVAVADTGIGLTEQERARLFERFFRGRPEARREWGTGLGLALAREAVRLLGGELRVESAVGRGSTFTLWLPLRRPEDG